MSLVPPSLDDRDFEALVAEAKRYLERASPTWTDFSPGDPGIVLVELFAHLTEIMLYRLNRLPEKAYVEFLRLIGVRLYPPAAARVTLRWRRTEADEKPTVIPRGTRVSVGRPDGETDVPFFVTADTIAIPAGATEAHGLAFHAEQVDGELAGVGTGLPGLVVTARRAPIIAPTGDGLDLVVAVAADSGEGHGRVPMIEFEGRPYRVWREVDAFTDLGADRYAFRADRLSGTISFAPAVRLLRDDADPREVDEAPRALAEVPAAGREIRLWYRRGGGEAGNVAAGTLTVIKDGVPGVEVDNPSPAAGGRDAETLENALARGPQELHSLQRAVTARDFELVALTSSRGIARAKAFTSASLWSYARPGTAEVVLVPYVPEREHVEDGVSAEALQALSTEDVRARIAQVLDERRPLGTRCEVRWAHYKTVEVRARVVVGRHEDRAAVEGRVLRRLRQTISPVPTPSSPAGWPFGRALRSSDVYDVVLAEPGVSWADRVTFRVADVPDRAVLAVEADSFQAATWYAGSEGKLFRSLNDGESWETSGAFGDGTVTCVRAHPLQAGLVAVVTRSATEGGSSVHLSSDAGGTWRAAVRTGFVVEDAAWSARERADSLLLATDVGLFELDLGEDASPLQVAVEGNDPDLGFYAVAVARGPRGEASVAVAAQGVRGVFLSSEGGRSGSFRRIDAVAQGGAITGQDVRTLAVQHDGPRSFLWAGVTAAGGDDPGKGCFRWELRGHEDPPEGWHAFTEGWQGGSCWSLAFQGTRVLAASHRAGVVRLETSAAAPTWTTPDRNCGLPLEGAGRFAFRPIDAVAVAPSGRGVLAGGAEGVYLTDEAAEKYRPAANDTFADKVALPPTWLFCSGRHVVEVVSDAETD